MHTQANATINKMTRDEIVDVLQKQGGYQCYDHEATEDLREVLRTDIERGVLPESILAAASLPA